MAEEKFKLPVYPVLVITLPTSEDTQVATAYELEIQGIHARQDDRVIQLSEVEVDPVFSEPIPTLLPFVPMMKGGDTRIPEAVKRLQRDPVLSELDPLLAFFAGFVSDDPLGIRLPRQTIGNTRHSNWHNKLLEKWL